jgi:DnaJ-class molecular chaperone
MPDALDGNFANSRAVLMGTWRYTEFSPVDAARHSLDRMYKLLTSSTCGWPDGQMLVVSDERSPDGLARRLVEHLAAATDVAMFYYVGHGQYDLDDELCLTLRDSSSDAVFRRTTSLPFNDVRHAFAMSKAATKIAILDCCFAELAAAKRNTLATGDGELPPSPGFYLMMASGPYTAAWFQRPEESEQPQTYFTKYLVDVIEEGIAGQGDGLKLGSIFDVVADKLVSDRKPGPRQRTGNHAGNFVFARNLKQQKHGRDIVVETAVSLKDALHGAMLTVRVPEPCLSCEGIGRFEAGDLCPACQGTGDAGRYRAQSLSSPPGVRDGERVKFSRLGWAGSAGMVPGDLYVVFHVDTHPVFARSGRDLTAKLAVSHIERRDGTCVSLRLLDGSWAAVEIPPQTPYQAMICVQGRGALDGKGSKGDLRVTLVPADPSDEARSALLAPRKPREPLARSPDPTGPVSIYRWSLRKLFGWWSAWLGIAAMVALLFILWAVVPALKSLPIEPNFLWVAVAGIVFPLHRRLFRWRRPPLKVTDDGLECYSFGFLSWADVAGIRPSAPGRPWITVVPRRTERLSTGRPNPLVLPAIMLSDLRGKNSDLAQRMKGHCHSLVVHERI